MYYIKFDVFHQILGKSKSYTIYDKQKSYYPINQSSIIIYACDSNSNKHRVISIGIVMFYLWSSSVYLIKEKENFIQALLEILILLELKSTAWSNERTQN